jgi:hypothetical protein
MPSDADVSLSAAGDRRRLCGRITACLAAACLLAACSSPGKPGRSSEWRGRGTHGPISALIPIRGPGGGFLVLAGTSGSGGRPKITVPPIPPANSNKPIDLPLNSYADVAILQQTVLTEADTLLAEQCMAARGFVYVAQATGSQDQAILQSTEYGFGVSSLADADTYGYGQPKSLASQEAGNAFLGGFASFEDLAHQPPAWTVALLGFAPGARIGRYSREGCLQQANSELYGSGGDGISDPVPSIAIQAGTWTLSDPRVLAVDAAWSRCMAPRGYKYRNPQQAADRNWPNTPTEVEAATAVADVSCKLEVNFTNTWLTVEAAYQTALLGQNLVALADLQSSFQKMLQRAEHLLTGSASPVPRPLLLRRGQLTA